MNVLLLTCHDIAEYDDVRMLTDLEYDVFSIGAYTDPTLSYIDIPLMRPPLMQAPRHPELEALCVEQRERHRDDPMKITVGTAETNVVDWAKADLHPKLVDWADAIIVHHYEEAWIVRQWEAIKHKRVIWRTCGQSDTRKEEVMGRLRPEGLEIVRYSPKERQAFGRLGVFAGEDTMIRFGKYREDFIPWKGDKVTVGNVTQNMAGRGQFCGYYWYLQATANLPTKPVGPESERLPGGIGSLEYGPMQDYLSGLRCYVYTGTQPASYTLGLIEAMWAGVPIVSIGPEEMWVPDLFEGHELANEWSDSPHSAHAMLERFLTDPERAYQSSQWIRDRAEELFDVRKVGRQWREFLGDPRPKVATLDEALA